ncbi:MULTISPECIES: RDD family protein [Campylobacter]|uniref:RDD family protein n=1 Tax=Campylobacter TaxID=194 RepID=UPI000A355D5D|nr:RDD family protein [Campylobacter sp. P0124]MCR8695975.1 RDD family protein [Campylobacter sp. RM19073]
MSRAIAANIFSRVKAFIMDMFFIAAPLLYIMTYAILSGKDEFQSNQLAIFLVWLVFGLIQSLFFAFKAQSPGYKAQGIYLVGLNGKKANLIIYLLRYFFFITTFIFGGSLFCFFRKDKRNLHDILAGTIVVQKSY